MRSNPTQPSNFDGVCRRGLATEELQVRTGYRTKANRNVFKREKKIGFWFGNLVAFFKDRIMLLIYSSADFVGALVSSVLL